MQKENWVEYRDYSERNTQSQTDKMWLWNFVAERENYFQIHTPTAFGNPDYDRICGKVIGYCTAKHIEESQSQDGKWWEYWRVKLSTTQEVYKYSERTGRKPYMRVPRLEKPDSYWKAVEENNVAIREIMG
jgi:hypothetical protein